MDRIVREVIEITVSTERVDFFSQIADGRDSLLLEVSCEYIE
jgi:hypothetical protein